MIKEKLNIKLYPLEAIYGACYVFIDKFYIYFREIDVKNNVVVEMKPKNKLKQGDIEIVRGEFFNELLNYTHRINISKNNKKIREYMVERALFSAIDDDFDGDNDFDDPLGIAVPWEEKYGDG